MKALILPVFEVFIYAVETSEICDHYQSLFSLLEIDSICSFNRFFFPQPSKGYETYEPGYEYEAAYPESG